MIIKRKTLFCKDAKKRIRVWGFETFLDSGNEEVTIKYFYGRHEGQLQENTEKVSFGNAGRTLEEQTNLILNSRIKKKLDEGYVYDIKVAQNEDRVNALGYAQPMKAQPEKALIPSRIPESVFVQRKYNGHRCLIVKDDDKFIAYSKKGLRINSIPEILEELKLSNLPNGTVLDGELYHHGTPLQTINSWVKRRQANSSKLNFICFDVVSKEIFRERIKFIEKNVVPTLRVIVAGTYEINKKQIYEMFESFVREKYEGEIVRFPDGKYEEGKRSYSVIKIKKILDAEFLIVNVIESAEGFGILVCVTDKGKKFRCYAPGDEYDKIDAFKNKRRYIGKYVKIEFSDWTINKLPQQPVALFIREPSGD